MATPSCDQVEVVNLGSLEELRVILRPKESVNISVVEGDAECRCWMIPPGRRFRFSHVPFAVSTRTGATVQMEGEPAAYYVSRSQPVMEWFPTQSAVTVIVGSVGVGKTTFCDSMCNHQLNQQKIPVYINADPAQARCCPQGCIGAYPMLRPVDNFGLPFGDPLVFFYGAAALEERRRQLLVDQHKELAGHVVARRSRSQADGGVVIDCFAPTCEWQATLLEELIEVWNASCVCVLGHTRLSHRLQARFPQRDVRALPAIPGAVPLDQEQRRFIVGHETHRYFYGNLGRLAPHTWIMQKGDVEAWSLGPHQLAVSALLPAAFDSGDPKNPNRVAFTALTEGSILACVPQATKADMWKQTVIGFFHVVSIEGDPPQIQILKPNNRPLPSKVVFASRVRWVPQD